MSTTFFSWYKQRNQWTEFLLQAIKQLRREVVDGMRALMKLAKDKQTTGMLPICEDMISKVCVAS
jgi:hypothetical protein